MPDCAGCADHGRRARCCTVSVYFVCLKLYEREDGLSGFTAHQSSVSTDADGLATVSGGIKALATKESIVMSVILQPEAGSFIA